MNSCSINKATLLSFLFLGYFNFCWAMKPGENVSFPVHKDRGVLDYSVEVGIKTENYVFYVAYIIGPLRVKSDGPDCENSYVECFKNLGTGRILFIDHYNGKAFFGDDKISNYAREKYERLEILWTLEPKDLSHLKITVEEIDAKLRETEEKYLKKLKDVMSKKP